MATTIKNFDPIINEDGHLDSETLVTNYWKDGNDNAIVERIFPLTFWKAHKMFDVGDDNKIALRVRNINTPRHVFAEWMPFEEGLVNALDDDSRFYVLDHTAFYGPIQIPAGPTFEGISNSSRNTPQKNMLCGRIGKTDSGDYHVFFMAATCEIITDGAGGSGPACGAKVPPGGQGGGE